LNRGKRGEEVCYTQAKYAIPKMTTAPMTYLTSKVCHRLTIIPR
jgi:hypothetical protein